MRKCLATAGVVLLLGGWSSAAGASDAAAAAKPPDACVLLPRRDVAKAFGERALATTHDADECWWESANGLKVVNLIRRTDPVAEWRRGYRNPYWTPNDYGDEGYTGKAFDSIVFRIKGTEYEVNVVYSTKGDARRAVEQLAKKVAARLGQ
jgi:hypothetical protein